MIIITKCWILFQFTMHKFAEIRIAWFLALSRAISSFSSFPRLWFNEQLSEVTWERIAPLKKRINSVAKCRCTFRAELLFRCIRAAFMRREERSSNVCRRDLKSSEFSPSNSSRLMQNFHVKTIFFHAIICTSLHYALILSVNYIFRANFKCN